MRRAVSWTELLVTDGSADFERVSRIGGVALDAGVGALMLREKSLSNEERLEWVEQLLPIVHQRGAALIVSEDLAAARRADGVHLSFRSPPVEQVRKELGEERLIGVSTHDEDEVERAVAGGADYVTFGPVHAPLSKDGPLPPRGVARTVQVARGGRVPVFALGGIGIAEAAELRSAGVRHIAFIGAVFGASDPGAAAEALRARATEPARDGATRAEGS